MVGPGRVPDPEQAVQRPLWEHRPLEDPDAVEADLLRGSRHVRHIVPWVVLRHLGQPQSEP